MNGQTDIKNLLQHIQILKWTKIKMHVIGGGGWHIRDWTVSLIPSRNISRMLEKKKNHVTMSGNNCQSYQSGQYREGLSDIQATEYGSTDF